MKTYTISEMIMADIITGLERGIENTQDLLTDHDKMLGRSTRKNKIYAEMLEQEIENMSGTLKLLKEQVA